jgi:YHS domain-containing protein
MKSLILSIILLPALLWAEDNAAQPAEPYPLETCVISGAKLDSMGGPYIHKHEGTEVRFCCRGCLPRFNRDPAKYLKIIEAARQKAP